jgi:hypothetical protein
MQSPCRTRGETYSNSSLRHVFFEILCKDTNNL